MTRTALPDDVLEAFASDSSEPLSLKAKDLDHFKGCVDRSGTNWQVPRPSARFLRLIRRLTVLHDSKSGSARLCAVVDVSQLPAAWAKPKGAPILVHLLHLVEDALKRSKVAMTSYRCRHGYFEFFLKPASVARATKLATAHQAFVGGGPAFLSKIDPAWRACADATKTLFEEDHVVAAKPAAAAKSAASKKRKALGSAVTSAQLDAAVSTLRAVAAQYVKALRLPDPKNAKLPYPLVAPSAPASPKQIADAERQLGVTLPASYRLFLSLHDGWKDFDLSSTLLSTKALVAFHTSQAPKALNKVLDELGRKSAEGLLVIATSGKTPMLIFDTKRNQSGEWSVLEYDEDEGLLDEHDNFLDALQDTADTLRMMAGSPKT